MRKYCLTWQGDGSLDLSQVLDDGGVPIIFPTKGAAAVVDEQTYKHPHVQNYLRAGLVATQLGTPAPEPVAAPPPAVVAPKPTPAPAPPSPSPPVPPTPAPVTVSLKETMTVQETPVKVDESDKKSDDTKKRGRNK